MNALLRSAVERTLTPKTFVILDALNLVKGFRYELFTRANAVGTKHTVLFCDTEPDVARARNQASKAYPEVIFEDLVSRLEKPRADKRWDQPLVIVKDDEPTPCSEVVDHMVTEFRRSKPSLANRPHLLADPTFVYNLDLITSEVTKQVAAAFLEHSATHDATDDSPVAPITVTITQKDLTAEVVAAGSLVNVTPERSPASDAQESKQTPASSPTPSPTPSPAPSPTSASGSTSRFIKGARIIRPSVNQSAASTAQPAVVSTSGAESGSEKHVAVKAGSSAVEKADQETKQPEAQTASSSSSAASPDESQRTFTFTFKNIPRVFTSAELQTVRRQFSRTSQLFTQTGPRDLAQSFCEFLQNVFVTSTRPGASTTASGTQQADTASPE